MEFSPAQFTFTLSYIHATFILTLTAVEGVFMSKYIPEIKNISHYRIVFIFKMSCPKAPLLRILPVSYARIQLPSPKRSNPVDFLIGGIKVPSIMPITSAFIGTIAKRKMPVEKLFSVA